MLSRGCRLCAHAGACGETCAPQTTQEQIREAQYARLMRNATKLGMVKSPFNYGLFVLIRPISFDQSNDIGGMFIGEEKMKFFSFKDIYFVILYFFFFFILNFSLIPFISRKKKLYFCFANWFDESMKISNFAIRFFDISSLNCIL